MLTDIDTIVARAENLCRAVAPLDLGDTPLYIVPQSRLPAHLGGNSICDGFTSPSLDLYLKDVIGPAWRGRGPCMVVSDVLDVPAGDDLLVAHSARQADAGNGRQLVGDILRQAISDDLELDICRIALHELAHILERPGLYEEREGIEPPRLKFEALVMGDGVAQEPADEPALPPFLGHEAAFIRTALHLRHRADVAGTLVPLYYYCAGSRYGLSHPNRYRDALGDEPARMATLSIRDMLRTPPPKKFTRLWARDLAQWQSVVSPVSERSLKS